MVDKPRTLCEAGDTCAFDRACEGFIRCADVDPIGWACSLRVVVNGPIMCTDKECDCPDEATEVLPAGEYVFSDAVDAVHEHVVRWR